MVSRVNASINFHFEGDALRGEVIFRCMFRNARVSSPSAASCRYLLGRLPQSTFDNALNFVCVFGHDRYQTQWYLSFRNTSSKIIYKSYFPQLSNVSATFILKHFSNQASGSSLFRIIGWKPWSYSRSQHCSSRPRSPISANSIRLDSWLRMRTRTLQSSRR